MIQVIVTYKKGYNDINGAPRGDLFIISITDGLAKQVERIVDLSLFDRGLPGGMVSSPVNKVEFRTYNIHLSPEKGFITITRGSNITTYFRFDILIVDIENDTKIELMEAGRFVIM